jgi:predicted amidohydrolase
MTAGLRVGIAQWTPGLDPGVNLRTARPVDGPVQRRLALCNGQWPVAGNQHGGTGADRMLGGSRVIAPDGRTVASAPRHRDLVSA